MNKQQYLHFIQKGMNEYLENRTNLKRGQAYMNVMKDMFPNIYKEIKGSSVDCSQTDENIAPMLNSLIKTIK